MPNMKFPKEKCRHCSGTGKVLAIGTGPLARQMREAAGISMRAMAKYLRISAASLHNLELETRGLKWTAERLEMIVKRCEENNVRK